MTCYVVLGPLVACRASLPLAGVSSRDLGPPPPPWSLAMPKVRENDGVQLGFRFKFVVFCPGLFFLCFLCFRRSGSPVLRVEKKTGEKKCPQAVVV